MAASELAVALLCAFCALVLGFLVSPRAPTRIDVAAVVFRDRWVPLAALLTTLGRWYSTTAICAIAIGAAFVLRANPLPFVALSAAQLASQGANMLLKFSFHRLRPDYYLRFKEKDTSFPSGHSVTAVVLFVGLAVLIVENQLPLPGTLAETIAAILAVCAVGIAWSRLSLGAHYLTDVAGGLLFGTAWLLLLVRFVAYLPAG